MFLAAVSSAGANVLYVKATAPGANDGTSWDDAFTSLPPAILAANSGDEIWVAAGTYKPTATTTRTVSFALKNGVGIYGGFAGTEGSRTERNPAANVTVLSGDIGTAGNSSDNSFHVVTADSTVTSSAVLDGFTITGGMADGSTPDDRGAGILLATASPTIAHCLFTGNAASSRGGAVRADGGSAAFTDCAFSGNSATLAGGAISAGTVTSLTLSRCIIRGNTAFDGARGGGIDATNGVTAVNCLIAQNPNNGVVFFQGGNTIADTTVTGHGGYGVVELSGTSAVVNSILWGDSTGETFVGISATLNVTYSDVQGGIAGAGNVNANPLFVNPSGGDWQVSSGSPAIDAGNNAGVPGGATTDLAGRPRFFDDPGKADTGAGTAPIVDMGAYERVPLNVSAATPASLTVCMGSDAGFSVTASGYPPLSYRWRRNAQNLADGGSISGAATASLAISPSALADSGSYDAVLTDPFGQTATSASATLTVHSCVAEPKALAADPSANAGLSDGNGILEPGETAVVAPSWKNAAGSSVAFTGTASAFSGPAGAAYGLVDSSADYGAVAAGATGGCLATGNCYKLSVSSPPTRPATHWDASFTETLSDGEAPKIWPLHVGDSFTDVPRNHVFYSFVERILHNGVTTGCTPTTYCPDDTVFRLQMAVFIARAQAGSDAAIPVSGTAQGNPYDCVLGGQSQFTDIAPDNPFCRHVHYIFATGVTTGCITTPPRQYCPVDNVSRGQMALFIARAVAGGDAGVPVSYGPDPVTGRSYSCSAATPDLHFTDITTSDIYCRHTHYLWAKDVISGFPDGSYGPALFVTRGAMAKFLANGFGLTLFK